MLLSCSPYFPRANYFKKKLIKIGLKHFFYFDSETSSARKEKTDHLILLSKLKKKIFQKNRKLRENVIRRLANENHELIGRHFRLFGRKE